MWSTAPEAEAVKRVRVSAGHSIRQWGVVTLLAIVTAFCIDPGAPAAARDENPIIADMPEQRSAPQRRPNQGVVDGFFQSIFGVRRAPERPTRQQPRIQRPAGVVIQPNVPTQPAPVFVEEKVLNAEVVVVFGDAYAGAIADGLDDAFANTNNVRIDRVTHRRSGLIGDDPVDWIEEVRAYLDSGERIDAAVIAVGLSDRKPIAGGGDEHAPLSERWRGLYGERIDMLLLALAPRQIPVIWVGLPPVADAAAADDYLAMNSVFRIRSQSGGGTFVDIWPSFSDEDGNYAASGPDVEGQERVLRNDNGIGFTRAGARKLGFFVERPLRRILRPDALDTPIANAPEVINVEEVIAEERETGIGRITALTSETVAVGIDLVDAPAEASDTDATDTAHHNLFVEGDLTIERNGRANDFSWPRGDTDSVPDGPRAEVR